MADLLEGSAGEAQPTQLAPEFGLKALAPAELVAGWDLGTFSRQTKWRATVRDDQPLCTIIGVTCASFWAFNSNFKGRGRRNILEALQDHGRGMLRLMLGTMKFQRGHGRIFLFEGPAMSEICKEPLVTEVASLEGVHVGIGDMCQRGFKSVATGRPSLENDVGDQLGYGVMPRRPRAGGPRPEPAALRRCPSIARSVPLRAWGQQRRVESSRRPWPSPQRALL